MKGRGRVRGGGREEEKKGGKQEVKRRMKGERMKGRGRRRAEDEFRRQQ